MKRSGPLLTLLAGLLLALCMLTLNATTGTRAAPYAQGDAAAPAPASSGPPTGEPPGPSPSKTSAGTSSGSPSPDAPPDADYAGRTDDGSSAVAVSLREGRAVAYFCDGRDREAWLKGEAGEDGGLALTGERGAELTGTLTGRHVRGDVRVGGRTYAFTADRAVEPSGLYRATATVRGAEYDGGWIVLPDGRQVGVLGRDGERSAAPRIDPEAGAVTVDGRRLAVRPVTP
ncbi:hypothetical protein [Streptomyces minutiscleroticus]|uniref:hypothetical protein n=1 Tax=Streptomyces minutiscleroticus TaxID=68238 RepID=UPI00331AAF5B